MSEENAAPKVLLVIPAFNEQESLAETLADIRHEAGFASVLVVDDGSSDLTTHIALDEGVDFARLPFNLGVGAAVQTGFRYAERRDFEFVVQFDADGQHPAKYVRKLIDRIRDSDADVVAGVRLAGDGRAYTFTFLRRLGSRWLRFLIWVASGKRFADPTCGLRIYNRRAVSFLAEHYPEVAAEPCALVLLRNNDFEVAEVSVSLRPRTGGMTSLTFGRSLSYMIIASWAIATAALAAGRRRIR